MNQLNVPCALTHIKVVNTPHGYVPQECGIPTNDEYIGYSREFSTPNILDLVDQSEEEIIVQQR